MAVEQRHVATQVLTRRRRGGALRNFLILEGTAPAFEYDAVWSVLALYANSGTTIQTHFPQVYTATHMNVLPNTPRQHMRLCFH